MTDPATDTLENELLKGAQSGEKPCLEELLKRYERLVYGLCFRMMGNADDASDMAQEVLIRVCRNIGSAEGIVHFRKWLYTVANNRCIDELRKQKRQRGQSLDEAIETDDGSMERQLVSPGRTPEQELLRKELAAELQSAIGELSPEHRAVIVMRDIRGLSYDDIAEITKTTIGTVKSRISRSRDKLRKILLGRKEQSEPGGVNKADVLHNIEMNNIERIEPDRNISAAGRGRRRRDE